MTDKVERLSGEADPEKNSKIKELSYSVFAFSILYL